VDDETGISRQIDTYCVNPSVLDQDVRFVLVNCCNNVGIDNQCGRHQPLPWKLNVAVLFAIPVNLIHESQPCVEQNVAVFDISIP
jgi:hypothetical protein